jgi:DNA repair photolyase
MGGFDEMQKRGIPFFIQLTHTNYPREIEPGTPSLKKTMETAEEIVRRFGQRSLVWRYDPIIFTDYCGQVWHMDNFEKLAGMFRNLTDEVTISYVNLYQKSERKMDAAGLNYEQLQPGEEMQREYTEWFGELAWQNNMQLTVCSQKAAIGGRAKAARCVDIERLSDIAGRPVYAPLKGNRPDCLCAASKDIGAYETCFAHQCKYCYAVNSFETAKENRKRHDPEGEFLLEPIGYKPAEEKDILQMTLDIIN